MDAALLELTLAHRLYHERAVGWPCAAGEIPALGEVVASHRGHEGTTQVIHREDGALRVRLTRDGWVHVLVAAATPGHLDELAAIVRHRLPPTPPADDDRRAVQVRFWSFHPIEPERTSRDLAVPGWPEIAGNYAAGTAEPLAALMAAPPPLRGGRLVLWHGPPGTGKTSALRALAWEWRDRVRVQYVTDPEVLLDQPSYMQEVLLDGADDGEDGAWRLVVLEDAGEMLAPDARERAGQGLSRLLNLTDGLVGQGLKVIVLLTGNDPLEHVHPAVARPGRCAASVAFRPFGPDEARAWITERGETPCEDGRERTLADLYAHLDGRTPAVPQGRPVGFLQ